MAENLPTDIIEAMDLLDAETQILYDELAESQNRTNEALKHLYEIRRTLTKIRITALVEREK